MFVKLARAVKGAYFQSQCSMEDIEALVNNLILFGTFAFAFAATLVSGTVSHEDLVEADQRAARIFHALDTVYLKDPENHAEPFSVGFCAKGTSRWSFFSSQCSSASS